MVSPADSKTHRDRDAKAAQQRRSSNAQREKKATTSPPLSHPAVTTASQTAGNGEGIVEKDADDFFARAKAMGLNLTRQDYERARAGVSAFLRAQRVEKVEIGGTSNGSDPKNGSNGVHASGTYDAGLVTDRSSPALLSGSGKLTSQGKLAGVRSTSSPMLSFFTAVIPSEEDEAKVRPSLDDVSSLEEKKRRRERRRRLKLRQEISAREGGVSTRLHEKTLSHSSSNLDTPPLTNITLENAAMPPPASRFEKVASSSIVEVLPGHVGLGLQIESNVKGLTDEQEGQEVEALLRSPVRIFKKEEDLYESTNLHNLSRKAHVDAEGRLIIKSTPARGEEGRVTSEETLLTSYQEDEDPLAPLAAGGCGGGGGADTDDSGVFFNVKASTTRKDWHRHERDSSDDTSPVLDLNESLDRMGILDRFMAQRKSPARLRREAKAKRLEAEREIGSIGNNNLVVMVATTAPTPSDQTTATAQTTLLPLPHSGKQNERLDMNHGKNVRWARGTSSPRQRMTTKEHYDFAFYGIAPAAEFGGVQYPIFEEEAADQHKRALAESSTAVANESSQMFHVRQRTMSVWMKNGLPLNNSSGSPIVSRVGSSAGINDSPGVLSMQFDNSGDRRDSAEGVYGLTAKRGLLFGPNSNDCSPSDMSNVEQINQGGTMSRSPARTVFDSYTAATPPQARFMTRSHTLAAPFSYNQQSGSIFEKSPRATCGIEEGSDRVMLMRAHSSGALDRRLSVNDRRNIQFETDEDKENHATDSIANPPQLNHLRKASINWAQRSPMGKYDTISPAALFGMSSAGNRIRVLSGDIAEMGRLPLEPSKLHRNKMLDEIRSDEEGDDEREVDASPAPTKYNETAMSSPIKTISRKHFNNQSHARDSSASTSVFEDSPMYLDIGNRTASIISTVASSSDLAKALGMQQSEEGHASKISSNQDDKQQKGSAMSSKKKRKALQQQQESRGQSDMPENAAIGENDNRFAPPMDLTTSINPALGRMEWDKPDGSRVIKLISEELQAALESGQLSQEPTPRYYKLPSDWGRSKLKPQSVSYAGMIGQAILSSSDGRLSLNEIYNWISTVFPFFERGDRGWQNSIRHNLSLNKSFIKVERDVNVPGKGGWWAIKEGHEDRFRGGSYIAPGSSLSQKSSSLKASKGSGAEKDGSNTWPQDSQDNVTETQSTRRKRQESDQSEAAASEHHSDVDFVSSQASSFNVSKSAPTTGNLKKSKKVKLFSGGTKKSRGNDKKEKEKNSMAIGEDRIPLKSIQASSPRNVPLYDSITPSRSYNFTASSGHGSISTNSMMASMPMLTDASSPPSSPNNDEENIMPPPSGGIHGAASSQSARKRKQAVTRALDMMNGTLPVNVANQQGHLNYNHATGNYSASLGSYNNMNYHHNVQASPLAHMRGNGGNVNGGAGNQSFVNSTKLRAGHGHSLMGAMDSPLRRHSSGQHNNGNNVGISSSTSMDSPSRLVVNSPISSVRDSGPEDRFSTTSMERSTQGEEHGKTMRLEGGMVDDNGMSLIGSPSKDALLRGSNQFGQHLQSHNMQSLHQSHLQQAQQNYSSTNSFLSPAGLNLQMAVGGQNSPSQQLAGGAAQFLNFGVMGANTPNRYSDQNNGNFIHQRWGMSPSPGKVMRNGGNTTTAGNLYYSQSGNHPYSGQMQAGSSSGGNLDDPFDYSGNQFQHEFEMTAELGNYTNNNLIPSESPIKMAYPQVVRNQFFHGQQANLSQQQQHAGQSAAHDSHQIQYNPYTVNLAAAANAYGPPPS